MSDLRDRILAEIKGESALAASPVSRSQSTNKAIYLAGKIAKNDWRHTIVAGLRGVEISGQEPWPILPRAIFNRFDYAGPYCRSDDHGCGHGDNTHGITGATVCLGPYTGAHPHEEPEASRPVIFRQCMAAITCADLVFVWLDSLDAYGTIFEMGVAHAMGKALYCVGPQRFEDLWFAYEGSGGMYQVEREEQTPEWLLRRTVEALGWLCDSPIEQAFWKTWQAAGRQRTMRLEPQHQVLGGRFRLDFAHLASKTAIELDGYDYHASKEQFIKDRERQRALEADGWYVVRFAGSEIKRDPESCCAQVADTISRRVGQGGWG